MRCEKMRASISEAQCLDNQKYANGIGKFGKFYRWYPSCRGCEQGEAVKAESRKAKKEKAMTGEKKTMTNEEKTMTAEECLMTDHEKAFEEKEGEQAAVEIAEEMRECKRCGPAKGPLPLSKFKQYKGMKEPSWICVDCKADIARENHQKGIERMRKLEEIAAQVEQKGSSSPARENAESPLLLTIDLSKYPEIVQEINRIAEAEDRTPAMQVRNWLRKQYESQDKGVFAL